MKMVRSGQVLTTTLGDVSLAPYSLPALDLAAGPDQEESLVTDDLNSGYSVELIDTGPVLPPLQTGSPQPSLHPTQTDHWTRPEWDICLEDQVREG